MQDEKRLTVREFIKGLMDEDMDAIVAFDLTKREGTLMANECWQSGTFYMKKSPRLQS